MLDQIYIILASGLLFGTVAAIVAVIISPLQFLKVIRQQTGDNYSKIFYYTLRHSGISRFFSGAAPYAAMNFLSSMAFGISEYFCQNVIRTLVLPVILAVVLRATIGGFTETLFSLYTELKEISKNKGSLMQSDAKIISILWPILLRNIIFWYGAVIAYEISIAFDLGIIANSTLGFFLGVLFGIISIPLDVIATQNCGAINDKGMIARFKEILQSNESVFAGALIRIVQIGIFTITTVITMFISKWVIT